MRHEFLARDHSDPTRYFAVVFFDSYESAMASSSLLETQASAEQYRKVSDGPPDERIASKPGVRDAVHVGSLRWARSLTGHRPGLLP